MEKTALRKALETTGDGAALLPYDLESYLGEELMKVQPLAELIPVLQAESKTHEYNLRTSHPMGWFEGESTPANFKNGTYARKSTMLKIQRIWGSVTGFARSMDEAFIDAFTVELEGSLQGMADVFEFGIMYACSDEIGFTGDAFQYSGLFPRLASFAPQNIIDAGGDKVTLADLDAALAKVGAFRQSRNDPKLWMMGLQMKQIVDGLQTKIQIPLTSTVLNDGQIVMSNYANSPIFETDYLVPETSSSSPDDLAGTVGAGGNLSGSFKYRIASVSAFGEQAAAAATDALDATAGSKAITLSWTADPAAKLYHIFRQVGGAGEFELIDIVPALTYDAAGTVNGSVESWVDNGSKTLKAVHPLEVGEEQILLLNRNEERGIAFLGKVDDMGRQTGRLMSFVELARVKDSYDYMIKSYLGVRVKYPNTAGAIIRNVKRS
jgi:hypothetical protein